LKFTLRKRQNLFLLLDFAFLFLLTVCWLGFRMSWRITPIWQDEMAMAGYMKINLIPFKGMLAGFIDFPLAKLGRIAVLTLVSLGLYLPVCWKRLSARTYWLIGIAYALLTELFCFCFIGSARSFDVNNILLSLVGLLFGYLLIALRKKS